MNGLTNGGAGHLRHIFTEYDMVTSMRLDSKRIS